MALQTFPSHRYRADSGLPVSPVPGFRRKNMGTDGIPLSGQLLQFIHDLQTIAGTDMFKNYSENRFPCLNNL
mgnify:CR=1 FL=1